MQEIIAGIILALDIVGLYVLLPNVSQRFLLSLWTAIWHVVFPLIGLQLGHIVSHIFTTWATYISAILLFCIGLQLLLSAKSSDIPKKALPLLALIVSIDSFSASVSFGMLNLDKNLFLMSVGSSAFLLSYIALYAAKFSFLNGRFFKTIAGLLLLMMSIMILLQ